MDLQLRAQELAQEKEKDKMDFISDQQAHQVDLAKVTGEHIFHEKELGLDALDMAHKHAHETLSLLHEASKSDKEEKKDANNTK